MQQERNACCFCKGPLVDGCTRLAGLERTKLLNWWKHKMRFPLDSDFRKKSWMCIFCVREARLQYEVASVKDNETVWWLGIRDPYFEHYTRGWLQSCSIQVAKYIDPNANQEEVTVKVEPVEREETPEPPICSGAVEQLFCEVSPINVKLENDQFMDGNPSAEHPISIKLEPEDPDEIIDESTRLIELQANSSNNPEGVQYSEMSRRAQAYGNSSVEAKSATTSKITIPSYQSNYSKHPFSVPAKIISSVPFNPPPASYSKFIRNTATTSPSIQLKRSATTRCISLIPPPAFFRKPMPKSKQLALEKARELAAKESVVEQPEATEPDVRYKCTSCTSYFPTNVLLTVHYTEKHKNKQECELCSMEFLNLVEVSEHQSSAHIFYGKAWLALDPSDTTAYKLVAFFKCIYCPYVAKSQCSLESHFTKHHKKYVAFKKTHCEVCNLIFPSFQEKSSHVCAEPVVKKSKRATQFCTAYGRHSTPQTCKMCKSKLSCAGTLIKHTLETKFRCRKCSDKFCLVTDAQSHMISAHKLTCTAFQVTRGQRATLPEQEKPKLTKIGKNEHYCVYCTNFYACKNYRCLKKVCNDLDDIPYACDECCQLFDTRFLLWKHFLKTKHKKAPKSSKFSQAEQDELRANAKILTEEDFKCAECGAELKKICYDFHMQVDHGKIAYLCKIDRFCGKMFYSLPNFQAHEQEHKEQSKKVTASVAAAQQGPSIEDKILAAQKSEDLRKPMPLFVKETAKDYGYGHKLFCTLQFENDSPECVEEA